MQVGGGYLSGNDIRQLLNTDVMLESYINEVTTLSQRAKQGYVTAMMSSNFWKQPHSVHNVDLVTDTEFSTPAIEVLMDALNNESAAQGSDIYFLLTVTDDESYALEPGDQYGSYPNNWMMRGQYQGPMSNKHVVWLEFRPLGDNYRMEDLNPAELVKKISRTLNHEIVHYEQLKKQSLSKGVSEDQAWEELLADPGQYSRTGKREDYLSRHIEIDAFAHEAAEELLDKYTPEQALDYLRYHDASAGGVLEDYITALSNQKQDLNNFMKKVYTHISMKKV